MRNIWILFKREMAAYFYSPIAYIVGVCVLGVMGFWFDWILRMLNDNPGSEAPLMWFFCGIFTWIVLLVVPPVITMRLFADEKKTGTIESLMTTPLRDTEYVLAKFLSGYAFFVTLWVPTMANVFVLRHFAQDHTPLNYGPIVGGYLGLFLIGMLFVSIGCMTSAVTRNQIIAAVVAFAISGIAFIAGLYFYSNAADKNRSLFEFVSMFAHMVEMSRGSVEWKRVAFYLSGTAFFLFVTHRVVQSRRWKS